MSEDKPADATPEKEATANVEDASQELQEDVFDLTKLNEQLGTTYKSVDEAVKGIKNLQSFVGAKEEKVQEKVMDEGKFVSKEQYEQDMFYSQNPDLNAYKEIINSRATTLGVSPKDAVENDDVLKNSLEKLRGYDDTEKAKSVLMSNPRLGQVTDNLQVAKDAAAKGDYVSADIAATKAVMDAIGK